MPRPRKDVAPPEDATPQGLILEAIRAARSRSDWRGLLACSTALRAYSSGGGAAEDLRAQMLDEDDDVA